MHRWVWATAALLFVISGTKAVSAPGKVKPMQAAEQQETAEPAKTSGQETTAPSKPNPNASGVYHAGEGVTAPQVIYSVDPEFSDKARKKKLGGSCTIGLVVDATGNPHDVHVVQSLAQNVAPKLRSAAQSLDEKAVEAVKQYKFKPATYLGKAVPYDLKIEIAFRIY